jgi:hypothetical protein
LLIPDFLKDSEITQAALSGLYGFITSYLEFLTEN